MRKIIIISVAVILLILSFLIYWNYYNVYSDGERKGTLIKITKKGNIFKTVEGEMWLSCRQVVNAEKFFFTIRDQKVAETLMHLQDECIQVTYKQYRKTFPWQGDNVYVVTGFTTFK